MSNLVLLLWLSDFTINLNTTHLLFLGLKGDLPERILDGLIAEVDRLIEYYHCAKFSASSPKAVVILAIKPLPPWVRTVYSLT